jgi:hypothetical protein
VFGPRGTPKKQRSSAPFQFRSYKLREDTLAPSTGHMTAEQLAEREARIVAHRSRVRSEMVRLGILPIGWDDRPEPHPPYAQREAMA